MLLYPVFFHNRCFLPSKSWRWRMGSFFFSPRHEDVVLDIVVFPVKSTLATICNDVFFKRCICVDVLRKMIVTMSFFKISKTMLQQTFMSKTMSKTYASSNLPSQTFLNTQTSVVWKKNIWTTADHDGSTFFLFFFFAQRRLNSGNRMGCEDVDLWLGKRSASVASQVSSWANPANAIMNVYDVN